MIEKLEGDFTHFDDRGKVKMIDVGNKQKSDRRAVAAATVLINQETYDLIRTGGAKKGDVLTVAQLAGIMGEKHTSELIPMAHLVNINGVEMRVRLNEEKCEVDIEAAVSCFGRTGVEMEALTAVSIAALTVYDMCKSIQRDIKITDIRLLAKTGGVHGDYTADE